jgi:hypothetical protein
MNRKDLSILGLLLAAGTGAFLLAGGGGDPAPLVPPAAGPGGSEAAVAGEHAVASSPGADRGAAAAAVAPARAEPREPADTAGWTTGVVRGDIKLAVSVLGRLEQITVTLHELRAARDGTANLARSRIQRVERGAGTPTFEFRDVPFSDYRYAVSVYSPGLNGSSTSVLVDAQTPLHDVELEITPGAPFTVLVRDQDRNPYRGVEVRMLPIGEPPGRSFRIGTTDAYGSVVFEDVLAGDYRVLGALQGQQLGEPKTVTVQPGARRYGSRIQGQGDTFVVPRGQPLEVLVSTRTGYGVDGATVTLQQLDDARAQPIEQATDPVGRVTFAHVTPGRWEIRVQREGYGTVTRPLSIAPDVPPERQLLTMARRD